MKWKSLLVLLAVVANASLCEAQGRSSPTLPPINSPATETALPGKFTWFDLATPSLDDQKAYYGDVFGWTYRTLDEVGDGYVLVLNGGQPIAGMFESVPPGGEQDGATWLALFSVTDVDQAANVAEQQGGRVEVAPATVPGRGRHALLRDPADAIFGVLASASGDPLDEQVPVGGIIWVDLFARDVDAMAEFYRQLAPWTVSHRAVREGGDGRMLTSQDQPRAGIVAVDEEANRSAWVPYVRVDDVAATLERAVDGGGFVIIAPDPELFDSNIGVFVDPNGGVTGVVRYEYGAPP